MKLKAQIVLLILVMLLRTSISAQRNETNGWQVKNYTEESAKAYFDNNYYLDKLEGIWQSTDGFKYSIEKDVLEGKRNHDRFRVILLESSDNNWKPTEIKAFIERGSIGSAYTMKYYIKSFYDGSLSSEQLILFMENNIMLSFTRLNGEKILLYKLYPKTSEESVSNEKPSNDQIEKWTGTCFAIGERLVATNYHVVENAQSLTVSGVNENKKNEYNVDVVLTDKNNDLAVLKITDDRFKGFNIPYGIKSSVSDIGTNIFVLGYPLTTTMGEDIKLTTGVISAKTGFQGDVSMYQISAPIQPGNSGGPLFDNDGNLIGIVSAKHTGAENVGYAIKLSYLNNLIESSNLPISVHSTNIISSLSLPDKVKAIFPCVLIVKANSKNKSETRPAPLQKKRPSEVDDYTKAQAQSMFESASIKYQEHDYDGSYDDVCKSVKLFPTPQSQYLKGYLAYYLQKENDTIIEALLYCLDNNYKTEGCYNLLSGAYFHKNDFEKCIFYANKILSKNRQAIHAYELKADSKLYLKDTIDAIATLEEAIKYDGIVDYNFAYIYNNYAFVSMKGGNLSKAEELIRKSLKHSNIYGNAWDTYGELNFKLQKYEECIKGMNNAITIGNHRQESHWMGNSYYIRGLAKKALGDFVGAYFDFEHAKDFGEKLASDELNGIDISSLDFSEAKTYSIITKQPQIKKASSSIALNGIEVTEEYTALFFSYTNTKYPTGGWYSIDPTAYIRDSKGGKYLLLVADNCSISPQKKSINLGETQTFILYFPAIPKNTNKIDFVESEKSEWKIYGIKLNEEE